MDVLHNRKYHPEIRDMVKGVMIESILRKAVKDICENYELGKSITDPCLGWEDTEKLIFDIYDKLEEIEDFNKEK